MMNIIILGAGAIGSLFGAKLSSSNDVVLIGKKKHVDSINRNGLRITGGENKKYKLRAQTRVGEVCANTVIILATKVYDSKKAILKIKEKLRKDTVIVCMQNGYGSEDVVRKIVGKKCEVLRGITAVGCSYTKPGTIKVNHLGYTLIEKGKKSKKIAENFDLCGLKASVSKNVKKDIWEKLIVNCMINPVTALLKIKNNEVTRKELLPLMYSIGEECVAVARKDGVLLEKKFIDGVLKRIRHSKNISSMYQDILKRKKTEIEYLNGQVVSLGKKYGVKCPVNEGLVSMVRVLEKK